MIHRTGFLMANEGSERYIQVETNLVFYQEEYITTGKFLLFEDDVFIGSIHLNDNGFGLRELKHLTLAETKQLIQYLRDYTLPGQAACASSFGFGLEVKHNLVYCEILVKDHIYHVWFDGIHTAKLHQNENFGWIQMQPQLLPVTVLKEISDRIEDHYSIL